MKTDGGGESATQEEEEEYGKPLGPPGVHFLNQIHEWGFLGGAKGDRAAVCSPARAHTLGNCAGDHAKELSLTLDD